MAIRVTSSKFKTIPQKNSHCSTTLPTPLSYWEKRGENKPSDSDWRRQSFVCMKEILFGEEEREIVFMLLMFFFFSFFVHKPKG